MVQTLWSQIFLAQQDDVDLQLYASDRAEVKYKNSKREKTIYFFCNAFSETFHISAIMVVNLPVLLSFCYLIIKVIAHCRLWCSGPFGTLLEVLIDEGPVSTIFKETRPPCHGRLDDFIPNNKQYVTWHSCVHSRGLEIWGLVSLVLWRDIKLVGYAK